MPVQSEEAHVQNKDPWVPIPGTSQELALDTRAHVTLYHGTRGPGKTDTQLMRFYRRVGMGYGHFWRGVIFDREYKNLDDLVSKSKRWFYGHGDGARFLSSTADYKWVWPTGEELLFRAVKKDDDYWDYHGQEFPFEGWNELCKYPTPTLFESLMSCNRSSFTPEKDGPKDRIIPPIPLEIFATANPYGPGHAWVKRRFIDRAPNGRIVRDKFNVFNPKTKQREEIEKTQVAIWGSARENIYLDPQYMATLEATRDVNKRKAWLEGDWSIVAGGAIVDVWDETKHVIPRTPIPANWRVDRAFDWGSSHPFATVWFAEANGEEMTLADGRTFCPRDGSLIICSELYGSDGSGMNEGVHWGSTKIAEAIRDHEIYNMNFGPNGFVSVGSSSLPWFPKQPLAGPADNQIRNVNDVATETIEKLMANVGVRWTPSDKSQGSRKIGLQLIRDRLEAVLTNSEEPGLYVMDNCRNWISTVPQLPRSPKDFDDVDTDVEDHLYDATRYRVLAGMNRFVTSFTMLFPS